MNRLSRSLALTLTVAVVVSAVGLVWRHAWFSEVALASDPNASVPVAYQQTLIGLAFTLCGFIVIWRTGNRVGWVLAGVGVSFGLQWIGWAIWAGVRAGGSVAGVIGAIGAFLESAWFPAMVMAAVVLPLVFPSGHLSSRRARVVAGVAVLALAVFVLHLVTHLATGSYQESFGEESVAVLLMFGLLFVGVGCSVTSLIGRFRRAVGVERQQIKWVLASLAVLAVGLALLFANVPHRLFGPVFGPLVGLASFGLVPVAIAMAILRYRLYDIERIISRTVGYTVLVAVLAGVFFGLIVAVQALLPAQNDLAVAASTLAVAALFNPLRKRVQAVVDRRFNRSKYNAQNEVDALAARLRDAHDRDQIVGEMLQVVNTTMQPSSAGVWVRDR